MLEAVIPVKSISITSKPPVEVFDEDEIYEETDTEPQDEDENIVEEFRRVHIYNI